MNAKRLFFTIMTIVMITSLLAISPTYSVQASKNECYPGTCEPTYDWQEVDKVSVTIDHFVCPVGYIDEGVSGCKKKVYDYAWVCPSNYSPTSDFPDGPQACKKGVSNYKPAVWITVGWHWEYTDKVNQPITRLVCPAGSEPHGNKCRIKVQTGWNCNCNPGTHPDGNGNCVPDVPPTCPVGQIGTPPDCHVPTCIELGTCCPEGQVGTPPDGCHIPTCEELGNCPTPKCTVPGLEELDAIDPNCKEPEMCEWFPDMEKSNPDCQDPNDPGDPIDPVIIVDPHKQDWTWPGKPDVPACTESRHELTWDQMMPVSDIVNAFYSLTVRCQDTETWKWDYQVGGWSCNLAPNQILLRISKDPFSVMWGGTLYPASQLPTGEWVLSSVADHGKGYVFKGTHSGVFSWDMVKNGQLEFADVVNFFVDTPPQWPGIDLSSYWKPYSSFLAN